MKITEDEMPETMQAMLVSLLVLTRGRRDFVAALAASPGWQSFTMPDGVLWRNVCYRYDFGTNPEKYHRLMLSGQVFAILCASRDGDPLIPSFPLATYSNEAGEYVCFYEAKEVLGGE